jgi:Zn-dependent protease
MEYVILFIVILFSAIVHEIMHGVVAGWFGDDTARDAGRITLNPIPHIDPFGTILLPAMLILLHSPVVLGAAKPVPVNIANMRRQRLGMAFVALAGPLSNFGLAIIAAIALRLGVGNLIPGSESLLSIILFVNILLGTFNLIPIPPLDGSKVIMSLLPGRLIESFAAVERYGFVLIIILLYSGVLDYVLSPVLRFFGSVFGFAIN